MWMGVTGCGWVGKMGKPVRNAVLRIVKQIILEISK